MLPIGFISRMKEMMGDEYEEFISSYEHEVNSGLRTNSLKLTPQEFEKITPFKLSRVSWTQNGFYYENGVKPARHPYYYAGLYYLQEPSAMAPAKILPVDEHDRVLDLCAAPGGKSTELASKLNGTGILVSNDISPSRAKALLKNLEIMGAGNILVTTMAPFALCQKFKGYFDKILVDAPCSGEGMFRKDKSVIKNYEQYGCEYYAKLQREIVLYACDMLKDGGMMVYSTCTFSGTEDEGTIAYLLSNRPEMQIEKIDADMLSNGDFEYIPKEFLSEHGIELDEGIRESFRKTKRIWPHKAEGEGHFIALLRKKTLSDIKCVKNNFNSFGASSQGNNNKVKLPKELLEFLSHIEHDFDLSRISVNSGYVSYLPEYLPDVKGLRVMRYGLLLGELKKDRFKPSQALAMWLKKEMYDNIISLKITDENVVRYLKGETVMLNDMDEPDTAGLKEGTVLFCVEGYPLGFAGYKDGVFKNRYLAGWRWM